MLAASFRVALAAALFVVTWWFLSSTLSSQANVAAISQAAAKQHHHHDGPGPVAHTTNGSFLGLHLKSMDQHLFLGIPYAAPPLGSLRFARPEPFPESWSGLRTAQAYGPHCGSYLGDYKDDFEHAEDCLTLNVVRPAWRDDSHPLPVAVYIHGGGGFGGGSSDGRYNLSFLISTATQTGLPFIGVSINYRSSIWGFIASRQIRGTANTNIGLHDQRLALHWVQDNIAGFGGDPRRVTLWGASSGADNVGHHLLAYGGRDDGLFRAAILQSGSPVGKTSVPAYPVQEIYDRLVADTGCSDAVAGDLDTLGCLRRVPYAQLNAIFDNSNASSPDPAMTAFSLPTIDGGIIPSYGSLGLKTGRFVRVPILSGVVSNEASSWIPDGVGTFGEMGDVLAREYPPAAIRHLMHLYMHPHSTTAGRSKGDDSLDPPIKSITSRAEFARIEQLLGDLVLNAAERLMCESYTVLPPLATRPSSLTGSGSGRARSGPGCHTFRFNAAVARRSDARLGVLHGEEIGPVFQNTAGLGFSPGENPFSGRGEGLHAMSRLMGVMWAGFITALDPNVGVVGGVAGLRWPRFSLEGRERMVFDDGVSFVERDADVARLQAMEYINSIQHAVFER